MLKKILIFLLKSLLAFVGLLVLLVSVSVAPLDRTPAKEFSSYTETRNNLKNLDSFKIPEPVHRISVGYSKVNLTPSKPTATGGYSKRKGQLYTSVLDSIYVRALVFDNGSQQVALVSADLLIIPPAVTVRLNNQLSKTGFDLDNTYLGAIHTHNSIGNWGEGAARFLYGPYNESIVDLIVDKITEAVDRASQNKVPSRILAGAVPVQAVENRMLNGGPIDSLLRVIEIQREDHTRLLFTTYTAHATCLYSRDIVLSRDYPGKLVDTFEQKGYDFAMFMSGAVGSHRPHVPEMGRACIDWMATEVSSTFLQNRNVLQPVRDSTLAMIRVPFALSNPQVKIAPDWKVRSWLFRAALGEYPVFLTSVRIGNIILSGTPCDFSGEFDVSLDSAASAHGFHSIVTSFNGGYVGYVTPQNRYDVNHYETQLMNWYAPGTGEYMKESLQTLIRVMDR